MRNIIFFIIVFMSSLNLKAETVDLYMYQVDPLKKVLKEQTYFRDELDTIRVARGETASIQIVLKGTKEIRHMKAFVMEIRSERASLNRATCGWLGYIRVGRSYYPPSDDIIRPASGYFPDPILPDSAFSIEQGEIQPLWISVPIDKESMPGIYKGEIVITGVVNAREKRWTKEFYIQVYPVTLDKSPLWVSNWSVHTNPEILSYMNNNEGVVPYSDLYWELIQKTAEMMASHRQNVYRVYPMWHTLYTYDDGKYSFDFSNFDREVEIFDKTGTLERIEGGDHLGWRSDGWDSPYYIEVPLPDNETTRKMMPGANPVIVANGMRFVKLPIEDNQAQNYLSQFLPALRTHLIEKGWYNKYYQHIADEPIVSNVASYRKINHYVKKYMPDVKIIDAVMTSHELSDCHFDIWVPLLDLLRKDYTFYQERQKKGEEVWFYTCLNPKENFANRFIELPLIQTRYLHWINYKFNITGYLHWGLNSWIKNQLHTDTSYLWDQLPAGDNCIIYPGYRKLYSSIRYEAMRDGIDDYQLLKKTEAKDSTKARIIVDQLIKDFDRYDNGIARFREVRKQMLDFLSMIPPKNWTTS